MNAPSSHTLVLSGRHTPDSVALWREAVSSGIDVVRAYGFAVPDVAPGSLPFLYGETIFADAVAEGLGMEVLGPDDGWLPSLPSRFLARNVRLVALADALSSSFPVFVKPPDDKLFPAKVYVSAAELMAVTDGFDLSAQVLVSEPVKFQVEWRSFVVNRSVVASSAYIRDGVLVDDWDGLTGERKAAMTFVSDLLDDASVALPPAMVIDVGQLAGGDWAVVEGNPAWCSGLCGCDPEAVLQALMYSTVMKGTCDRWARRTWVDA